MLFGCRCPLVPHQHMNTPVHQTKNSWFSGPYLTSLVFGLRLLHRWLCRWHLGPNSDMQLWLQHLCLHMTYACNKRIVDLFMIYDFWLCGYPSIWRTATDKYWELNRIDMLRYLLLLMRVALQVCEPHTALDFPEKNIKSNKKSNRTLKFTCSNCSFQLESSQMILKTSKHHIAAAPLAQMESQQSLLPAVLPCKHQRCVVPTLDEENCGRLWQ